jgi:tRNA(fMet)-specific endonuclease VapC
MYILDTDHLSVLERGGDAAQNLLQRLATIEQTQVAASIISYEEQMRGWLSLIAKAEKEKKVPEQVKAYKKLRQQLKDYCVRPILEFDEVAAQEFQRLKKLHRQKPGTMDLKIAAIALVNKAILLTRNDRDFRQVANLSIEDWTQK